jgi:L,D-peptidoglycan transpeptidase YkuD (ErfK/YbiS/YcfS/YnhG family)
MAVTVERMTEGSAARRQTVTRLLALVAVAASTAVAVPRPIAATASANAAAATSTPASAAPTPATRLSPASDTARASAATAAATTSFATVPGTSRFPAPATTRQVIVVRANGWSSTTATVLAYARRADGRWVVRFGPMTARLGRNGLRVGTSRHEGDGTTPAGSYAITTTFGRLVNPGTRMPYRLVRRADYWVGDSASRYYNTLRPSTMGGFRTALSEHLAAFAPQYDYAAVVDFNRPHAVPGRGSAIFLHITDGRSTAGCVAISRAGMTAVLRWLDPAQHPRIVMGPTSWLATRG